MPYGCLLGWREIVDTVHPFLSCVSLAGKTSFYYYPALNTAFCQNSTAQGRKYSIIYKIPEKFLCYLTIRSCGTKIALPDAENVGRGSLLIPVLRIQVT